MAKRTKGGATSTLERVTVGAIACLVAAVAVDAGQAPPLELSDDERQVIEAVLKDKQVSSRSRLVDVTYPSCEPTLSDFCFAATIGDMLSVEEWAAIPGSYDLRTAFRTRNASSFRLGTLGVPARLVSKADAQRGGSFLRVTAPGFDSEHTRAVVYLDSVCQPRCGSGAIYLVERQGVRWRPRVLIKWSE